MQIDQEAVVLEDEHNSEVIVELDAPPAKVPEAVVSEPEAAVDDVVVEVDVASVKSELAPKTRSTIDAVPEEAASTVEDVTDVSEAGVAENVAD